MLIQVRKKRVLPSVLFILHLLITPLFSGKVYVTKYRSDADVNVYVTKYRSEADLVVFVSKYSSDATGKDEIWFFTKYRSDSDISIRFSSYKSESDIIIYFSKYKSEAAWLKSNNLEGKFKGS